MNKEYMRLGKGFYLKELVNYDIRIIVNFRGEFEFPQICVYDLVTNNLRYVLHTRISNNEISIFNTNCINFSFDMFIDEKIKDYQIEKLDNILKAVLYIYKKEKENEI